MGFLQVVCMGLLATVSRTQGLQNCSEDITLSTVADTADATNLADLLDSSNGTFTVQWVGEVRVNQTISVPKNTSLNITGTGPGATADGQQGVQLFKVDGGTLHLSNMTLANGRASKGGAISASSSIISFGGSTSFVSNSADEDGGAIYAFDSIVSWDGNGTEFSNNEADGDGGAIYSDESNVFWKGAGTEYSNNHARGSGGAVAFVSESNVSWYGDGTTFRENSADSDGGAIFLELSNVSWTGNGTEFRNNSAQFDGGAIYLDDTTVLWHGDGTEFSSNHAKTGFGGAIYAKESSRLSWNGSMIFSSNVAGEGGGAVALIDFGYEQANFTDGSFVENSSKNGGAFYIYNFGDGFNFTNVNFELNSVSGSGGAFAVYAGTDHLPSTFSGCSFSGNTASSTGGAVETLSGEQDFISCDFEGNSADVGGAMRLGGDTDIRECSFVSNLAYTRGLAIAVVGIANISGSSFSDNELYCAANSYREDTEQEESTERFQVECDNCPDWDECLDCNMTRGNVTPQCMAPLEHTAAHEPGNTVETLDVAGGYWRATNTSEEILACFHAGACSGGRTGAESFCSLGYQGPYCSVCDTDHAPSLDHTCTRCSSSARQGLIAVTAIVALVAVFAIVTIFKFLLSTERGEGNNGWLRHSVLRALPVQALKIIVVVWQILTQFADAANATYPGVYQDFLNVIDVVNFDLGSALTAGCLWSNMDFHDWLFASTLGPLAVVGVLAVTYRIAILRNGAAGHSVLADNIRHKHQTALLLLTFLVYSSVSSMVFKTFACETLEDDVEYLRADYRINCADPKHKAIQVYASIMIFVYPVGIPLLYAILLFQRRGVLSDADADKSAAQPISSIWESYRPERFYYEVVECGRRIMLTGVVVFIFPNDAAQIAITMLIAFFFFAMFEVLAPYKSQSDMWLSRGGHVIVFLSMYDLLLLKVDVSDEGHQSQAIFGGVLVAGHVLMVLAIIVEVAGVCYASRKKQIVEEAESFHSLPGLRPRIGSDDVPVSEVVPVSWRSLMRQVALSEETGATQSSCRSMATAGRP